MHQFTIFVETDNPDFIDKLKRALQEIGLDTDNSNKPHYLELELCNPVPAGVPYSDYIVAGWVYEPDNHQCGACGRDITGDPDQDGACGSTASGRHEMI